MDANQFKESLSKQDVYSFLDSIHAEPQSNSTSSSIINCRTVCHGGDGHNLRYYSDTYSFNCFSNCGSMSIYDVVSKTLDLDFYESFKYVLSYFNYSMSDISFKRLSYTDEIDVSFFDRGTEKTKIELQSLSESRLDVYYDLYYQGWIDEGISVETMQKFKIKNSIIDRQIIIPHYDEFDRLIGIRCRNLKQELVDEGKKYMPVFNSGQMMNHSTGSVLYGLNFNKDNINRVRKVILFESEKSVLQLDSYLPEMSIGVCLSGSNLTNSQVEILKDLNVDEVIIALDKEFSKVGGKDEKFYAEKIEKSILNKLSSFFNVSIMWDLENDLETKMSPTDAGPEVFKKLLNNRLLLN